MQTTGVQEHQDLCGMDGSLVKSLFILPMTVWVCSCAGSDLDELRRTAITGIEAGGIRAHRAHQARTELAT